MFGIINFSAYLLAVLLLVLLPGPNMIYCLSVAGQYGTKTGWSAFAGIFVGNGVLIVASTFGASALLQTYPSLFNALQLAGGAYLAYLGIMLLKAPCCKCSANPSPFPCSIRKVCCSSRPSWCSLSISATNTRT